MKYNFRNIFLKLYSNCVGETSRRTFSKKSLDYQSETLYSLFLLYDQDQDYQTKQKEV